MSNEVTPIGTAKKAQPLMIPYKNAMHMMDAFAKHYGLGLQGQWGQYSGVESIVYTVFGDSDNAKEVDTDELIDAISAGIMVYPSKDKDDAPPIQLNAALHDLVKKLNAFKEAAKDI